VQRWQFQQDYQLPQLLPLPAQPEPVHLAHLPGSTTACTRCRRPSLTWLAVADVLRDGGGKQCGLLADQAQLRAQEAQLQAADVHAVQAHLARQGVVETLCTGAVGSAVKLVGTWGEHMGFTSGITALCRAHEGVAEQQSNHMGYRAEVRYRK